jgi:hypothetical protein
MTREGDRRQKPGLTLKRDESFLYITPRTQAGEAPRANLNFEPPFFHPDHC